MVKKVFVVVALVACFCLLASAQKPSPKMTLGQQGLSRPTGENVMLNGPVTGACANADCIFYGGDGNPSDPNADGLWVNNSAYFGISGSTYSPFVWSKAKRCGGKCAWEVDGLFANDEYYPNPPTVDSADWAILSGVATGGTPATATTVCSGTGATATLTATGNVYFGFYVEYATSVPVAGCRIKAKKGPATFWEAITVNTSVYQLAYESNSPQNANAIGTAEPVDDSFFYGPAFGISTFVNATTQGPFHTFSAGVCAVLGK
jgi:hypothetical protein